MSEETQVVEINGMKLEVDMRTAKRVDTFKIGTKVKLLVKSDYGESSVCSGVIAGFEPFEELPTLIVCYIEMTWNEAKLKFVHINEKTRDKYEIVASLDETLPIEKADIVKQMDKAIEAKQQEIADIERKRDYFLKYFNQWFESAATQ
jgi:hypothetical protein